ncbi:MAG TPA: tetratricopeptide repeat protein [Candidatus Acidoferrum sp.]|nr:tetratricopeptide repeat protein [Candidatus Acidoferrum sp.]
MDEQKPKQGRSQETGGGLRAPAKGESGSSEVPLDSDGATFLDIPPRKPPADPGATIVQPNALEGGTSARTPTGPRSYVMSYQNVVLQEGDILGGRYEILQLLGEGGMGAVYKAKDREVERIVALKLIRPEMASNPVILARFKQELLTAHRVTHKNVIRIYDLAEADGVKFITMEFVEGNDLRQVLREREKLSPDEAVDIIRQVCMALDAAHTAGIIHRDLKPQNIMRDKSGRILVMDFGLARSVESEGMTQTGALLGTIEYMSPEQAMGKPLDQRSDLFAVGLIFYELLSGKMPFKAETAMASLLMRNQERAVPVADIDATVPAGLSDIVARCLERDLDRRYPTAAEIITDLDAWQGKRPVMASIIMQAPKPARKIPWKWVAPGAAVVVAAGIFLAIPKTRQIVFHPGTTAGLRSITSNGLPALSQGKFVAVMPFRVLGDAASIGYIADGLGESLSAKLFQLKEVHVTSADAGRKVDPNMPLPQIAKKLGANMVVQGTVQGNADQLRITVKLENVVENKTIWNEDFSGVPGDILALEDRISGKLVTAMGANAADLGVADAGAHPTDNADAYDLYLRGRNAMRGQFDPKNFQTAIDYFNQSLKKDPNFALAYTGLADASLRMYSAKREASWSEKALTAARRAAELNDKLPEAHMTLGTVYRATGQNSQAIAELKRGLALAPNSDEAYSALGNAYASIGQKDLAIEALEKAVEINPYYWMNANSLGQAYLSFGDNERALKAFQQVVQLEPDNASGYNNVGAAYFNMGRYEDSISEFKKSLELVPDPQTYSSLGTALFYLKRYTEAVPMFEKAAEMSPSDEGVIGNLGDGYRWAGQQDKANQTYKKAIALCNKDLQVNPRNSNVLAQMALYYAKSGDPTKARELLLRAKNMSPGAFTLNYAGATIETIANKPAEAVAELKTAIQKGQPVSDVETDPEFTPLRTRADYQALIKEPARNK